MKILGFKVGRYLEWMVVVWGSARVGRWEEYSDAEHGAALARSVEKMVRAVLTGRVGRRVWWGRMKTCGRCPVRTGHVCLIVDGNTEIGCGCFTVFKGLVRAPYPGGCWAKHHAPGLGIGWSSDMASRV
jgi:hypothetical protein